MAKKQALCWFIAKTSYICRMYMQKNEILVYIHPLLVLYHIREIRA